MCSAWTPQILSRVSLSRNRHLSSNSNSNNGNGVVPKAHQFRQSIGILFSNAGRGKRSTLFQSGGSGSTSSRRTPQQQEQQRQEEDIDVVHSENQMLKQKIEALKLENQMLKSKANMIILENFEGQDKPRYINGLPDMSDPKNHHFYEWNNEKYQAQLQQNAEDDDTTYYLSNQTAMATTFDSSTNSATNRQADNELWCDSLEEDGCPVEPTISFGSALRDRAYWLVGLLIMQSFSGIILSHNEALLASHPVIIYFLTMLVGAGGNAGNQASVRVIRGLALGTLNEKTRGQFLSREIRMAGSLSLILSITGFCRAIFFKTPLAEALAVTAALALIVFTSVVLGAILPIVLEWCGVDPAHSSTTIQVVMDILGVIMAVTISRVMLDGPLGEFLVTRLSGLAFWM